MSLLILRDSIAWFGSHTGYEQLASYFPADQPARIVKPRRGRLARYAGSTYARLHGRYGRGAVDLSEVEFRCRHALQQPDASHMLYLEPHLDFLKEWRKTPKNLIGTIHLPPSVWKPEQCESLSRLGSAIILYQRDIPFFENYVGKGRVRFIHYGVDTEFFKPDSAKLQTPPRILYSGVYLRNEPMLVRMVQRIFEKMPEIKFDLLVPMHHRKSLSLAPLLEHPAVTWHTGLNDEQLRELYQKSYLLLLPMNDSGANTAVVEVLASGLPVVTTDVGGIRDYGGGTIFPVVANNDDGAMISLLEQYLSRPAWRDEVGKSCRNLAEGHLAWPVVAQQHLDTYKQLVA